MAAILSRPQCAKISHYIHDYQWHFLTDSKWQMGSYKVLWHLKCLPVTAENAWSHSQHCGYWCPGAKAPGHQYPQCLLSIYCTTQGSYKNITFTANNTKNSKVHFEKKRIPRCFRVNRTVMIATSKTTGETWTTEQPCCMTQPCYITMDLSCNAGNWAFVKGISMVVLTHGGVIRLRLLLLPGKVSVPFIVYMETWTRRSRARFEYKDHVQYRNSHY